MSLLFRSPLINFDIHNSEVIQKHWPEILERIKLSSQDLFKSIHKKLPDQLSDKEQKSVYKYLIRGRYRPTPFGKWAGVGIANWENELSESSETPSECSVEEIQIKEYKDNSGIYWLNPSIQPWSDGWRFWNFDREKEVWRYSKVQDGPLIQKLKELAFHDPALDKERVLKAFSNVTSHDKEIIWDYLLESQLLVNYHSDSWSNHSSEISIFIKYQAAVSLGIKEKMDKFLDEIGRIAVHNNNGYLDNLTKRFREEFDDRFVPLSFLWKLVQFLNSPADYNRVKTRSDKAPIIVKNFNERSINLREIDFGTTLLSSVKHSQALFRVLQDESILIDNLVFNRPFVYSGRFTNHPKIHSYFKGQIPDLPEGIFADVLIKESGRSQYISSHKSVVRHKIICFQGSVNPFEIDSQELFVGLGPEGFKLYSPRLGKEIFPIFQHPLNPQYITHPLCRMLWEIAHQNLVKPIIYVNPTFSLADSLPQLNWDDIILQPRMWRTSKSWRLLNDGDILKRIEKSELPRNVLIGIRDQELALDLTSPADRKLFLEEIKSRESVSISEWLWYPDHADSKVSEQFLWGKNTAAWNSQPLIESGINLCRQIDSNWICFKIILSPDFRRDTILELLKGFTMDLELEEIRPYYFLYYSLELPEIRVRIKARSPQQKEIIWSKLFFFFYPGLDVDLIKLHTYYPENEKYGFEDIEISERLFYMESKLILELSSKDNYQKLSIAVQIGEIIINGDEHLEKWISVLDHRSKEDSLEYLNMEGSILEAFLIDKDWLSKYSAILERHSWERNPEKRWHLLGNHLHMLVNRLFWEEAGAMEVVVHKHLTRILKRRKFEIKKAKNQ